MSTFCTARNTDAHIIRTACRHMAACLRQMHQIQAATEAVATATTSTTTAKATEAAAANPTA